jgi:hypothetical protein
MEKDSNDYLTGLSTGASCNPMSSLGARHAYSPPPPEIYAPPKPPPSPPAPPPIIDGTFEVEGPAKAVGSPRLRRSAQDRWAWGLAATLTGRFDSAASRMVKSPPWRRSCGVLAVVGALLMLGFLPPYAIDSRAEPWSAAWLFALAFPLAAGAAAGGIAPPLALGIFRCLLWLFAWTVTIASAIVVLAAGAGAAAVAIYLVVLFAAYLR